MALGEKEKKQLLGLAVFAAGVAIVAFWMYWRAPRVARAQEMRLRIDSLQARVDSAKRDLASGTVEQLRERVREYEASLRVMRRLVPTGAEVPSLIDDVNARAKRRRVHVGDFSPQAVEPGTPFETHRYQFAVLGHYDEIGEFLSDVASLSRIMVPYDVTLNRANETVAQTFQDTTGALLRVDFKLRTFVKPASAAPADSVPGGGS
jgi:type IV pilus assembly protein PilO